MSDQEIHPDVMAAIEYSRRAASGIPADRWTDGTDGDMKVARGIARLVQAVDRMVYEEQQRGAASMEPYKDPARGDGDAGTSSQA